MTEQTGESTGQSLTGVTVTGVIIRADGRREELGVVACSNPSLFWRFSQWLHGRRAGTVTIGDPK